MRERERLNEVTELERETLSDGSIAHNVILDGAYRIACIGESGARELASCLERVYAWGESL